MPAELFLDTETTGTDPVRHRVWEIGAVKRNEGELSYFQTQVIVNDKSQSDQSALKVCRFKDRYQEELAVSFEEALLSLIEFSRDTVLFGLNISFDISFLRMMAEKEGFVFDPGWHYSPVELKSYASGRLGLDPTTPSHIIAEKLGIEIDPRKRHSALGDAELSLEIYDRTREFVV